MTVSNDQGVNTMSLVTVTGDLVRTEPTLRARSNKDVYPTNNYSQPFTESEI